MKRFYKLVSTSKEAGGYAVLLDGRAVNTPLKNAMICPSQALADEVLKEWAAQEEIIVPESMPLTQLVSTKIDRIAAQREAITKSALKYLNTDLICYRAEDPPELAEAQKKIWSAWLDWFAERFGTTLETTTGLKAIEHPKAVHEAVKAHVETLDDDRFTVFQLVTSLSGSLVLALAFVEGAANAQDVFKAARVEESFYDELYKADKYGQDPMQEKKDAIFKTDLEAAERFLSLV